ncbi:MAG: STAS domain-containing protein, partial [Candidatus Krumholzibacteriia bacterium]
MGGRDAVPQTRFARMPCSDPEVTVFRISGSLGPRARSYLVRLTQECLRRDLPSVVLDLSDVDSLGGGSARLLNEFAAQRAARGFKTAFRVTSPTVRGFLYADHALQPPPIQTTLEQAIAAVRPKDRSLLLQGANPDARVGSAVPPGVQADDVIMSNDFPGPRPAPPIVLEESGARQHVHVLKPHPGGGGTPQAGSDMPYAGGGTPQAGSDTLERASSVGELQECLVRVLRERKLASRIHVFEQHADDKYYLVTRHGIDFERGLAAHGALARRLREHGAPGFLFDLCTEQLADSEEEVLAELNCEVVAPVTCGENTELLVFLSKEQPGDEYTLAELQEVETVLRSASAVMEGLRRERIEAARGNRSAAERVSSSDSGFPREPASELELVEPGATLEPRRLEHGGSGMEPRRVEHGGS